MQLAGLVDDADRLVHEVARANPWLAWWCVEEGRDVSKATRDWVEERSVQLLRSGPVSDRRRAVQALVRIGSERTIEPLFQAAADRDPEVAGPAVQSLANQGETVRVLAKEALQGSNRDLWRAALRYLATQEGEPLCTEIPWQRILGQPLVWVTPGPFLMGSDKEHDPDAVEREQPRHTLALPGYWIGRYPVTVAQFRTFMEATGYRASEVCSFKEPEDHPAAHM